MPMIAAAAATAFAAVSSVAAAVGTAAGLTFTGLNIATAVSALKVLSVASSIYSLTKKPRSGLGSPSSVAFKADPNAPIQFVAGKAATGGNIVLAQTHADKNRFITYVTALSHGGPVVSVQPFMANDEAVTFNRDNGEGAGGRYQDRMWQKFALGAVGAAALLMTSTATKYTPARAGALTEWTAQHKLSGIAHTMWTMWADTERYPNGIPKPLWIVHGGPVYDPREDSTMPGGAGAQRWNDRNTWSTAGNENPHLQALTFLIGHTYNGVRLGGAGVPIEGIDVEAFAQGANVADANGWKVSLPWNTSMRKWDVLATMLQAGGARPIARGAKISCVTATPRVSIGTITEADIIADFSVTGSQTKRERKNTVIPKVRAPALKWSVQPFGEVTSATYLAEDDGERRSLEIEYEGVNGYDGGVQARQLAAYDLTALREGLVATLPCGPKAIRYRAGDCLTIDAPETLMNGQKVVVIKREFDPHSLVVNLTVQSETDGKHAFALGLTEDAPPTPGLTGMDPLIVEPPAPAAWVVEPGVVSGGGVGGVGGGGTVPVIVVRPGGGDQDGTFDQPSASEVVIRYRRAGIDPDSDPPGGPYPWMTRGFPRTPPRYEITGLSPNTTYEVQIAYRVNGVLGEFRDYGEIITGGLVATGITEIGGRPADEVVDDLNDLVDIIDVLGDDVRGRMLEILDNDEASAEALFLQAADLERRRATTERLGLVDGIPVGVFAVRRTNQLQDGLNLAVEDLSLIGVRNDTGTAFVLRGDVALTGSALTLAETFTDVYAETDAAMAAVGAEQTARIAGDAAEAASRTALGVALESGYTAAVADEASARADADSAEADARLALAVSLEEDYTAAIAIEAGARADADGVEADARTALAVDLGELAGDLVLEAATRGSADGVITTTIGLLGARNGGSTAFVINEATAQVGTRGTVATVLNALTAADADSAAEIILLQEVTDDTASFLLGLSTTVDGQTDSIALLFSITEEQGARVTLALNSGDRVVGLFIDGDTASFVIAAEEFAIAQTTGGVARYPFAVTGEGIWFGDRIYIGTTDYFIDPPTKTIQSLNDAGTIRHVLGSDFGAESGGLSEWRGDAAIDVEDMTVANSIWAVKASDGKVYYGTVEVGTGGTDGPIGGGKEDSTTISVSGSSMAQVAAVAFANVPSTALIEVELTLEGGTQPHAGSGIDDAWHGEIRVLIYAGAPSYAYIGVLNAKSIYTVDGETYEITGDATGETIDFTNYNIANWYSNAGLLEFREVITSLPEDILVIVQSKRTVGWGVDNVSLKSFIRVTPAQT